MASVKVPPLRLQVTRVYRRLVLQTVLNAILWCWAGAILLAAVWFLVQPLIITPAPEWLRWAVAGGLAGVGTFAGVALGIWRAPSKLVAALSLDSEFGLKERVTTSLLLQPEQEATPAGQALLADVDQHVAKLDVGSRFPVRMHWHAVFVPACGVILALIAVFYEPGKSSHASTGGKSSTVDVPQNLAEINHKMKDLKKAVEKNSSDHTKSEDLKALEAELEKIANRPTENKEQIHERIKEMTGLEEAMKNKEKELAEKSQALKSQLKQLDKMKEGDREGPAKDLEKALAEGKFDKAREEAERLAKRMESNQLTQKEKEQLQKQLEDLQKKLDRIANQKDKEEALKKAGLDPETLKREMEQLKKDKQKLKDLQELAKQMGKACEKCKQGEMKDAAEEMSLAGQKMKEMQSEDGDLTDFRDQLRALQDAKDSAGQDGDPDFLRDTPPEDQPIDEDSPDNGGVGAGRRPLGKKKPFKSFDAKAKVDFDTKGKKIFDGYAQGQNFKKRSGAEIAGEIKQASQEAPEAIEQQRIPKAAQDMAKEYFQKMREQAEKDLKKSSK